MSSDWQSWQNEKHLNNFGNFVNNLFGTLITFTVVYLANGGFNLVQTFFTQGYFTNNMIQRAFYFDQTTRWGLLVIVGSVVLSFIYTWFITNRQSREVEKRLSTMSPNKLYAQNYLHEYHKKFEYDFVDDTIVPFVQGIFHPQKDKRRSKPKPKEEVIQERDFQQQVFDQISREEDKLTKAESHQKYQQIKEWLDDDYKGQDKELVNLTKSHIQGLPLQFFRTGDIFVTPLLLTLVSRLLVVISNTQ